MLASALRRLSLSAAAAAGSRSLLAQQLEGELAAEARAALLRQHAFIGAVGYFNRHAIQRAQPQPRSMTPVGDARTQSQPQPSAFSGGYDQRSVDDDDDDDEVDEDDDEDDGDAADAGAPQLRFVVCLLGNDLDAVTPAEIADIGWFEAFFQYSCNSKLINTIPTNFFLVSPKSSRARRQKAKSRPRKRWHRR